MTTPQLPENSYAPTQYRALNEFLRGRLADASLVAKRLRMRSLFSPSLSYGRHFGPPTQDAKAAAVLMLIEPHDGVWSIPLTVRHLNLADHPGQISFPGGQLETDETHRQAAEREFAEELGISPFPGDVLGELQPIFVFNSNYDVRPFLAICEGPLTYALCPSEVDRLIYLPLTTLIDPSQRERLSFSRGPMTWTSLTICHDRDRVWGATAMLLGELAALLEGSAQVWTR